MSLVNYFKDRWMYDYSPRFDIYTHVLTQEQVRGEDVRSSNVIMFDLFRR